MTEHELTLHGWRRCQPQPPTSLTSKKIKRPPQQHTKSYSLPANIQLARASLTETGGAGRQGTDGACATGRQPANYCCSCIVIRTTSSPPPVQHPGSLKHLQCHPFPRRLVLCQPARRQEAVRLLCSLLLASPQFTLFLFFNKTQLTKLFVNGDYA